MSYHSSLETINNKLVDLQFVLLLSKLSCGFSPTDFLEAQILLRTVVTRFMDYRCGLEQNLNMPLAFP